MKAGGVMVGPVIAVKPDASVQGGAKLFPARRIGGVWIVDGQGEPVGIISEGDLTHRSEIGTTAVMVASGGCRGADPCCRPWALS